MNPRVLELSPDCMRSPSRLNLIGIETLMLWPKNGAARAEAQQTAVATFGKEVSSSLDPDMLRVLLDVALSATPLTHLRSRVAEYKGGPFVQGLVAGEILFQCLRRAALGSSDASMKCVMQDASRQFSAVWPVKPKTIENSTWPTYGCVSHFWAAYRQFFHEHGTSYPFPCRPADLSDFLGVSEAFRKLGERTKTRQSPVTILRPSEMVRLPDQLDVPEFDLTFHLSPAA